MCIYIAVCKGMKNRLEASLYENSHHVLYITVGTQMEVHHLIQSHLSLWLSVSLAFHIP